MLLIPSLSWGLTFKDGKQVDDKETVFQIEENSENEKYFGSNYVFKPQQKIKWLEKTGTWPRVWEMHGWQSNRPWALQYSKDIVRDGKYSIKFEKRENDCGPSKSEGDCVRTSANWIGRSEIMINNNNHVGEIGNNWYSWSIYMPKESDLPLNEGFVIMGQFKTHTKHLKVSRQYVIGGKNGNDVIGGKKGNDPHCPELSLTFYLSAIGLMSDRQGVEYCNPWDNVSHKHFFQKLIDIKDMKGQWHDIVFNTNWTDDPNSGFIKIWVNGELKLDYSGKTVSKMKTINGKKHGPILRFGVYSQKWKGTTIVYYDRITRANKCEDMKLETLGYSCNDLVSKSYVPVNYMKELVEKSNCVPGRQLVYKEGTTIPEWKEVVCD